MQENTQPNAPSGLGKVLEFFDSATLSEVLQSSGDYWERKRKKAVIVIESTCPVHEALKTLATNDITSAPVLDRESNTYVGFVDVFDILSCMIGVYTEHSWKLSHKTNEEIERLWKDWFYIDSLTTSSDKFSAIPIRDILGVNKVIPVHLGDTITHLCNDIFSKGIHRAPVVDDNSRVISIVTQSDILKFTNDHIRLFGRDALKTIEELELGTRNPFTIRSDIPAIHGYYLLSIQRLTALPVVDETGKVVANLSASDVRGLDLQKFSALLYPVTEFIATQERLYREPIVCKLSTPIETIVHLVSSLHIHRVWVVDDAEKPIGVVSLTDIIKYLSSNSVEFERRLAETESIAE